MAVAGSLHRRAVSKPSCWKAECVERRPLRLEGGKDCKVLPILTARRAEKKTTSKEAKMYSDADRAKVVHTEAKQLEQFLRALSPADWQRPSACDRWQVADVVAHLSQMVLAERITRGLQGDLAPPQDAPRTGTLNEDALRESVAQRAIGFRERTGEHLLSAFVASNDQLHQVLSRLAPQDWETLCQHPMGPEPVRTWIDMRITELAMHGWDIRSSFDPQTTLSAESIPALLHTIPRAV